MAQAFDVNGHLTRSGKPPTGTLGLTGYGHKQSFDHKIIRTPGGNSNLETTELKSVANLIDYDRKKPRVAVFADDEE